jgi:hypothetical protein
MRMVFTCSPRTIRKEPARFRPRLDGINVSGEIVSTGTGHADAACDRRAGDDGSGAFAVLFV